MKKTILLLIFTVTVSAQVYLKDADVYREYADSIKNSVRGFVIPDPPAPLNPLELFGMDEKDESTALKNFSDKEIKLLKEIKEADKMKYYELLNRKRFRFSFVDFPGSEKLINKKENEREDKIIGLEIETEALSIQYKNASDNQKDKIKSDLKSKLNVLFDLKEEDKKREVESLEKKLKELKTSLEARKKNKDEIVNRRVRELTGESKYLRWD
ncbi:MAG: hypothetical protein K8F60_00030 [Melioribacteraceae bacterium]|jgi:hypothetical protein|nr:hypothetical protein [Ignavibacteriota bacterium]MBZ0180818.1 hypothetical protein [Melioribacteraceae bacterium]